MAVKVNSKRHSLKSQNFKQEVIEFTRENRVVTTSELASHFKVSWNTAEKYMLELVIDGKIMRIRKAGVNLWLLK